MEHIVTVYTHEEGRQHPNLIRYFWDPSSLSIYTQLDYLIDGIHCPEERVQTDPSTAVWNASEACVSIAGTDVPGRYQEENGDVVVVYKPPFRGI